MPPPDRVTRIPFTGGQASTALVASQRSTNPPTIAQERATLPTNVLASLDALPAAAVQTSGNVIPFTRSQNRPLVDFNENPLGAIGLVLSNTAAGLQGQPLPTAQLSRDRAVLDQQAFENTFTVLSAGLNFASALPGPERAKGFADFITQFQPQIEAGGLTLQGAIEMGSLLQSKGIPPETVAALGPFGEQLAQAANGDAQRFAELVLQNQDKVEQSVLRQNQDALTEKLAGLTQGGLVQQALGNEFTPARLQAALNRAGVLTANENAAFDLLERDKPEFFTQFDGIVTVKQIEEREKEAPSIITVNEGGKTLARGVNKRTGATEFEIETGKVDFDAQEFKAALATIAAGETPKDFSPAVMARVKGTTQKAAAAVLAAMSAGGIEVGVDENGNPFVRMGGAGARASERLKAKREFELSEPIPNELADLAGLPIGTTVAEAREQGIALPDDVTRRELLGQRTGALSVYDLAMDAQQTVIEGGPQVLSVAGSVTRIANNIRSSAIGVADLLGVEVEASFDPSDHLDALREAGLESGRVQSLAIAIAFARAAATGQTGRAISDRDIDRFIRETGTNAADPVVMAAVLGDIVERTDRELRNRVKSTMNATLQPFQTMSDEQLGRFLQIMEALPSGQP